ncbi:GNAT family N-acetyltransferase [Histidinibacterium lentulum]|uniref:GNAT family N-acetyltransferase n=1 Tax=Histidinibacterium lentulum TaxID=2480588 RepID=A0A3N2R0X2_9RHOB|nr:GNAT family N-acetyltransferase [Histidinibacterium lentulum]ROU01127.1 GNAT family N-acetyltransferase [Histidinibacterium lentulum]
MSETACQGGRAARLAALHAAATDSPWTEADFADLLNTPGLLLLEEDAAFLAARTAADEAEILMLATHPSARRRGRARALLHRFHAEARTLGAARAFLEVAADNHPAAALYAAQGYREIGRRRAYYRRPAGPAVDAICLARGL